MNPIISHMSALNYLDRCARKNTTVPAALRPKPHQLIDNTAWAHTKRQLDCFDLERFRQPSRPLEILVPYNKHMHAPKGYLFHGPGGALCEGSLLGVGEGVLTCSPKLLFLMFCARLPLDRRIKLGSYLCGTYSPEPTARSGVVERYPLTRQQELKEFCERIGPMRGLARARETLAWVLDGAASPQETELAMPFYLPRKYGGKGFVAPKMNHRINLTQEEQGLAQKEHYRVDVYWPDQRVGFEYNSYSEHSDPRKIGEDERRRLIMRSKGIHVELVSKEQLDSPAQIDLLAAMLDDYGVPHVG